MIAFTCLEVSDGYSNALEVQGCPLTAVLILMMLFGVEYANSSVIAHVKVMTLIAGSMIYGR